MNTSIPPTIPWYKSNTLRGLAVALLLQIVAWLGLTEAIDSEEVERNVDVTLGVIEFLAISYAAWARARQPTPPVSQAAALKAAQLRQGGFARPLMLAVLLAVSVAALPTLSGCASLGLEEPRNLEDRIAYAYGTHTAIQRAAAQARNGGAIEKEDAQEVLRLADDTRVVLDGARELYRIGDAAAAGTKLELANQMLLAIREYLNARGVK